VTERSIADWERIEADFRAGVLSLRELAALHSVSHQAIAKRAKAKGWERDLAGKIKAKADALVAKALVDTEVDSRRAATETETVDANAKRIADVQISHRKDIARFRKIAIDLLAELEAETGDIDLFTELGIFLRDENEKGVDKRNDLYHKVISSAGRVSSTKQLAETLKILIGLEREAYGLSNDAEKDKGAEGLAQRIENARKRAQA
jgi:hypothetical protein